jgi:hypothetical protein
MEKEYCMSKKILYHENIQLRLPESMFTLLLYLTKQEFTNNWRIPKNRGRDGNHLKTDS